MLSITILNYQKQKISTEMIIIGNESIERNERVGNTKKKISRKENNDDDGRDADADGEDDDDKIVVKTHAPEVGDSIRGWTFRASSYVAAKMAFFERMSTPDNSVNIRKTTFLER